VEDTGVGIAAEELPRVFLPFVQEQEGHTRTRGGTGLGLTISRQLARLMGGDLTAWSEKGRGSAFSLWLPAAAPVSGSLDPAIQVGAGGGPGPRGVREAGDALRDGLSMVVEGFAARVRDDPLLRDCPGVADGEVLEQTPVLVADLASSLVRLARAGGAGDLLREGSEVQRIVADEHGADRARRGWTAEALHREFTLLREALEPVVRGATHGVPRADAEAVRRILGRLLGHAHEASLRSLRAASVATGPADAP
jgi:hypothetical protein